MAAALLEMRNIDKVFPGVRALSNVDFTLHAGEIHSLMGENGAGKSTLVKVLTGVYPKDGGTIHLNGREISPKTPKEAQEEGISTVYQEVNLCPNLTVAENIFIGREPRRFGFIDWKEVNRRSVELLQKLDVDIDVNKTLDNYPVAIQQMVAIARAVDVDAKILILDEPTSSLNEGETARLFKIVRQLQKQGMGIIFISHFLEQIYELCDHITILRNGELVGSYELAKLPRLELIARMVGKDLNDVKDMDKMAEKSVPSEEVFIDTDHAASIGQIKDVSLQIHKGEVIGFAGLLGSGRTETAEMLFGLKDVTGGQLKINGKAEKLANPMAAMKDGIAFCPEDRKLAGIIGDLTVRENIILALQAMDGMFTHIPYSEQVKLADQFIEKLRIKVSDRDQLIKNLSGGNQQKVIIARWLATHPQFLILDEPTRGIDVGTKTEIQKMAVELAKTEGMSVAFISSEMDEMVRTCSKLIVMRDRRKVAELTGEQVSSDGVMQAIAGGDN
ncbi:MAG: sugar ABC transporter ATP-binding protein [Anaerovibrio sp.]|uniref:sugar ABC transporter ATP-binding protein n=2 Tax=Anaerovibrio TaxID=82373 RepID=UPI002E77DD76|nr:sugar ABC transporter ATP-binding protein [Anaerovibrio sp.]MEE1307295.1 sugar ABC transporter ATP-binding protein [Anaerovibrio sp.]